MNVFMYVYTCIAGRATYSATGYLDKNTVCTYIHIRLHIDIFAYTHKYMYIRVYYTVSA